MAKTEQQYTVGLYTLGCKVAQYETEAMLEEFERLGFLSRPFDTVCDVYVINTCTVTAESDRKCRQVIRRAYHKNPAARILVCGCYAQTAPQELEKLPGVSYISGTGGKMRLPAVAKDLLAAPPAAPIMSVTRVEDEPFEHMCVMRAPRTRAYVKIEDGCECHCTYCAIPGARGLVRSKAPAAVVQEVMALAQGGCREVVLTGIETASYGVDLDGTRLIDLLEQLDRTPGVPRLRLGSLTPELIRPDFVHRLAALRHITPHLHLSMQSGSDDVLRGMRRRYHTAMVRKAMKDLRAAMPDIQITTDMMVGFPGEGDAHFAETMAFCREADFLDMHIFAYSRRPGTPAATMPGQVPPAVKHDRSLALQSLRREMRMAILARVVKAGKPLSVLFETGQDGLYQGHSDTYIEVEAKASFDPRGAIYDVHPCGLKDEKIYGEIIIKSE